MSESLFGLRKRLAALAAARATLAREGDDDLAAPVVVVDHAAGHVEDQPGTVPDGMRVAAGWAWRLLVLGALVYYVGQILGGLSEVTIPLVVALLLTAAFWPLKDSLVRAGLGRGLAAGVCLLALALLVLGILFLVSVQITAQWTQLSNSAISSFNQLIGWLKQGPFHITNSQIDTWLTQLSNWLRNSEGKIAGYATAFGTQLSHFFAGMALALFAMFYFLYEGPKLARASSILIPRRSRHRILEAAGHGWVALVAYVRAAVIVAAVDGLGALIGAFAVGSTTWLAIGALTFLTAFVPLVGALFAGTVATAVVFVTLGPVRAIIMLAVFVAVMEIEGHVMQPFLLGRAVSLHPLAVLYGIAVGVIVGGFIGALFTVPLMAFTNAFARALAASRQAPATPARPVAIEAPPPSGPPDDDKNSNPDLV